MQVFVCEKKLIFIFIRKKLNVILYEKSSYSFWIKKFPRKKVSNTFKEFSELNAEIRQTDKQWDLSLIYNAYILIIVSCEECNWFVYN